ncbi:MAG: hypothetical protein ACTHOG_10070 [Marmoricola sp.]
MSDFLARHGGHIIGLGGPLVLLVGLFATLELTRPDRTRRAPGLSTWLLALMWAAVATIHLTVIGEHFGESAALGTFFLILTLIQYGYALAALLRPTKRLLLMGMVANTAVVLLWTYTRVVEIPFGLGEREPVGAVDLTATVLEVGTVALTVLVLWRSGALRERHEELVPTELAL